MGWELSSWLAFARSFQLLGSIAAVGMHGYLTIRVYVGKLGLSQHMVALELLICAVLGYTTLCIFFSKRGRAKNTSRLTCFVVCDVIFCGVMLAIITLLAQAGLPVHCGGMTEEFFLKGDKPNDPDNGYTTVRFSDEDPGERGELDKFCGFERSFFTIAVVFVFTYILTIVLTILRIMEQHYTKNTKVSELLDSLDRAEDIHLKILDIPSPHPRSPSLDTNPPQPPSEGVITRNTSLRSTFTTARSSISSQATSSTNPYRTNFIPRRPIGQAPPPLPQRPLPPSSHAPVGLGLGVPTPLDEEDSAHAALVTDGMQHRHQPSREQQPPHHPPPRTLPILSEEEQTASAALVSDGMQHRHQSSRDQHPPHPTYPRMLPMLSEEDQAADAALVSDGMRPEPTLPPYHPGYNPMPGHAGEDNEMRLSEYVKGGTRAQEMKDSGRY